jgi:hemerythrin
MWAKVLTADDFPDLGHGAIDEEHRLILRHIGELRDALAQKLPPGDQRFLLHEFEMDPRNNCRDEEEVMVLDGFPEYQFHRQAHEALYRMLHRLESVVISGHLKAALEELRAIREVVEHHILHDDSRIAKWHRLKNISPDAPD